MRLSAALLLSLLRGEQILLAFGQAPDAARLAQQYLFGLAWGVASALCFLAIRNFMGAVNRPAPTCGRIPKTSALRRRHQVRALVAYRQQEVRPSI